MGRSGAGSSQARRTPVRMRRKGVAGRHLTFLEESFFGTSSDQMAQIFPCWLSGRSLEVESITLSLWFSGGRAW